jgi:hypothetical protein
MRHSLWYNALTMWPAGGLEAEEHVELIRIINKQLLLRLVGYLPYYLYQ